MSLTKKLCLRTDSQNSALFSDCLVNKFESKEDNYKRDSFDDRFCDDLCEDILQYLSLEDKLRLECVSKQFQRTVFQRHFELHINIKGVNAHKNYLKNKDNRITIYLNYNYIEDQSLDSFKALLKKCPNITSIKLDTCYSSNYNPYNFNQVFQLIIENFNNLSEINLLKDINDRNFVKLYHKFGQKIKYLPQYRELLDLIFFPNIEKLRIRFWYDQSIIPHLTRDNLKQLDIDLDQDREHWLQTMIKNFPKLTHLKVISYSGDENAIYESLKNISNLKHLIHFYFHIQCNDNCHRFCGLLKQMAKHCRNLKSLNCSFNQNSDLIQFLTQLKAFSALKRLWLDFVVNEGENIINFNEFFSFELFKGFENITHLSLGFNSHYLKESIIKEIDINLPKLQFLEILYPFDTTPEGVTQMADILSRLSRLETLKLFFKSGVDFKPIEEQITEKCRKIKDILFDSFPPDPNTDSDTNNDSPSETD